jgi:hypothetical protein
MMRPPSALSKKIAVFRQVEMPQPLKNAMEAGMMQPGTLRYKAGKIHVLVSPPFKAYGWHMSISCHNRYPTWDEVVAAWYTLVPGAQNR